jgi:hypothetical protein
MLYCILGGQEQDAAAFLGLYLKALDEELVALHTFMSTHKPASTLKVEELEEVTQSPRLSEVGERDYTVRQFFFL